MARRILAALAALLLGLAVVGMVSPTLLGLGPRLGIRLGFWPNSILLALGTTAAYLASHAPAGEATHEPDAR